MKGLGLSVLSVSQEHVVFGVSGFRGFLFDVVPLGVDLMAQEF